MACPIGHENMGRDHEDHPGLVAVLQRIQDGAMGLALL
jgi:hypothetical protein